MLSASIYREVQTGARGFIGLAAMIFGNWRRGGLAVFDSFSRTPELAEVARRIGMIDPRLLQSMYLFKPPRIGGEVTCRQDATFLDTDPITVVGLWFALEDATIDTGCLWAQPGGHRGPLRRRFERKGGDADGTRFEELDATPRPAGGGEELVPLETPAGTLVVLHGLLPHWSGRPAAATRTPCTASRPELAIRSGTGSAAAPACRCEASDPSAGAGTWAGRVEPRTVRLGPWPASW